MSGTWVLSLQDHQQPKVRNTAVKCEIIIKKCTLFIDNQDYESNIAEKMPHIKGEEKSEVEVVCKRNQWKGNYVTVYMVKSTPLS